MKKISVVVLFLFTLFFISTTALACSCVPYFSIDDMSASKDYNAFSGKVVKVIGGNKAIVKVDQNYSINSITRYEIIYSTTSIGTSCGTNFNNYKNDVIFVYGEDTKTGTRTNSCSVKSLEDGNFHRVQLGDTNYDQKSIQEVKNHLNYYLSEQNKQLGTISENSLNPLIFKAVVTSFWFISIAALLVIIGSIFFIFRSNKRRKAKKYL